MKILAIRIIHGVFTLYFIACLVYLYYAAITSTYDIFLAVAFVSLAIEGFAVYILNDGNCPLLHIHKAVGDEKTFFELFLPKRFARKAMPMFARLTWVAVGLLAISIFSTMRGL